MVNLSGALEIITGIKATPFGEYVVSSRGDEQWISKWNTDVLGEMPTQQQIDEAVIETSRPKYEAKKLGIQLETLRPYYVSRSVMNNYQAMDAAGKEAFRAQFDTGTEDRWTIIKDFILNIRQLWSQNPVTWAEWDANNPTYTQADFVSAWATINAWASE